jgi:hypothetical protein
MAAGYTTSLLLNAQARLAQRFQQPEMRTEPYNLIRGMLAGGQNLLQGEQLNNVKTSDSRTVETFVFAKRSVTAGNARAHNHTLAAFGDSQKVTLSFSIASGTYGISEKMGGRNIFDKEEMLANDLMSAQIAINNAIEADVATYLSTYKTQSNAAAGAYSKFGSWDGAKFHWAIPVTEQNFLFQYISRVMGVNDYDVPITIIADPVMAAIAAQLVQQGQGNSTNLGWQFQNMTIIDSRRVADTSYVGTCYAFPTGTVGMVDRIPRENIAGVSTRLYDYMSMPDPLGTPLTMAVHTYESGASTAVTGGETQDVIYQYENSVDYSLVKAPLSSAPTDSPIFKFVLTD